jgi:hypothetical protein
MAAGLGAETSLRNWMKRFALFSVALWAVALILHPAASAGSLNCDIGPISKSYGKTQWYVYSCDDNRSVVVVSAPGNPATPFYFMFSPNESGYRLVGEGTGRKDATSAAFDDLKTLTEEEIAALIEETRAH